MYTTIREFVENSLDAAESIHCLPEIQVTVEKLADDRFNELRGLKDDKNVSLREYFVVTCKDNGMGMKHQQIPNMLGVVLSSTKYGLKQSRGKFGLGAKMALVWSKKSTGLPIEVLSCTGESTPISHYKLDIDVYNNVPCVILEEQLDNESKWRGTEISVVIEGKWSSYRVCVSFVTH